MSLDHKISDHTCVTIPHGDLGGPLVADIPVFVVPSVSRRQAGNDIDLDTLEGVYVDMSHLPACVEVSDSHISELALAPLGTRLNRHQVRELFQLHFFPVIPTDQVFPPQHELSGFGVVNRNPLIVSKVVSELLAQVPASVVVMVPGNPQYANRSDFQATQDGIAEAEESLTIYFRVAVVCAIYQGSLGSHLVCAVEVQEVVAYRKQDFFDRVGLDALQHCCNASAVIFRCDLKIIIITASLFVPTKFPEVTIIEGEFNKVFC